MSDSLPLSVQLHIEEVCARFEAAWQVAGMNGLAPRLEKYLDIAPGPQYAALLRELILLELHYRRQRGEIPTTADCPAGSPALAEVIHTLFPQEDSRATVPYGPAAETVQTPPAGSPGLTLPGHEFRGELGRGGMGEVIRCHDPHLGRDLAVKLLAEQHRDQPSLIERFLREARIHARLQHPGIVPVHELGELPDRRPYFTMKVVEGRTLAELLAERAYPADELPRFLTIFEQVCQALAYAHSQSVIHRDLKPHNVMVGAFGEVQVMDWGLAKVLTEEVSDGKASGLSAGAGPAAATEAGVVLGTLAYIPPEQARGDVQHLDRRSDVFGLGAILCEILTGQPPYVGEPEELAYQTVLGCLQPALARLESCGADRDLAELARQCLRERPEERPADAGAVAEALAHYQARVQERLRAAELERATAAARAREDRAQATAAAERRTRRLALALAAALLVGITSTLFFLRQARDAAGKAAHEAEEAEAATKTANQQEQLADSARTKAEREHERAEYLLYVRQLELAQRAWLANDLGAAWDHLEATRWDFRGWEYRYLRTLFVSHQSTPLKGGFAGPQSKLLKGRLPLHGLSISPEARPGSPPGVRDQGLGAWLGEIQPPEGRPETPPGVLSLAFGPDGRRIAGAFGQLVRVWETATGREVFILKGHSDTVNSVCFSPDGQRLASASSDGTVRLWDAGQGSVIRVLNGRTGRWDSVCFSPDGRRIAGGGENEVRLWDAQTGQKVFNLEAIGQRNKVCFRPDGRRLATALLKSVREWDADTGQEVRTVDRGRDPVYIELIGQRHPEESLGCEGGAAPDPKLCYSPDGRRLARAIKNTVTVWDADSAQLQLTLVVGQADVISDVGFSPDGRRLLTGSTDQTVRVWDADNGQELLTLEGHAGAVRGVSFSPDGQCVASAGEDGTVRLWKANRDPEVRTLKAQADLFGVCFAHNGGRLVTASLADSLQMWDAQTGREVVKLTGHTSIVLGVGSSPDGRRVASAGADGTVRLWDADTGQELHTLRGHRGPVHGVCFSPDSQLVASAGDDGMVRLWNANTGQKGLTLRAHTREVEAVCFNPDGRRLASASHDRTVRVWDVRTGGRLLELEGHTGTVFGVCFSPDGRYLASASEDQTVKVWDGQSGRLLRTLEGHTRRVCGVCFGPDSRRLASASQDRTVKLWNAETGRELRTFIEHTGEVTAVVFSPDGHRLATCSEDQTLKVWDLE
jgi:WD40 repeat protein